jgi:hypothetical protein
VARERGSATEIATSERLETARTRRLAALYADRTFRDAYVELERLLDQEPASADAYRFLVAILAEDGGTISRVCCSLAESAGNLRDPARYRMRVSRPANAARQIAAQGRRFSSPRWTIAVGGALAFATAIGAVLAFCDHGRDLRHGAAPPAASAPLHAGPVSPLHVRRSHIQSTGAPRPRPPRAQNKHRSSTERHGKQRGGT